MTGYRTIDFRKCTWGHNISMRNLLNGGFTGFVWCTPGPKVGDHILWKTAYGHCELVLTDVEWTVNVNDMYKVEASVYKRVADPEIVSQEDLDAHFGGNPS